MSKYVVKYSTHLIDRGTAGQDSATSPRLDSPEAAARLALAVVRDRWDTGKEENLAFLLGSDLTLAAVHHLGTGGLTASVLDPRVVLGVALREGAPALIVTHTHPSGSPLPSPEDLTVIANLARAARTLDVLLADFLVVGCGKQDRWWSWAKHEARLEARRRKRKARR